MNSKEVRSNNKACDKSIPLTAKKPIYRHPDTGIEFRTCPSNFYQESYVFWIDISKSFEMGLMTFDLDEPNKNVEARKFVDRLRLNYQREQMG